MSTAVYVHFPWCLQKCPYCDFASASIRRTEVPHREYSDAVLRELAWHAERGGLGELRSVFFGGGTPSLWAAEELGRVVKGIKAAFTSQAADLEVTVECNPSSLDEAKAHGLAEQGVNRLSVGVQALDGDRLRYLGRLHDAEGALQALRFAQKAVPRVSGDLMFGTPGQPAAGFLGEVERLVDLGLSHMSIYALTIEPNTQFGELHRKGRLTLAKDDDYADTFSAIEELLEEAGLQSLRSVELRASRANVAAQPTLLARRRLSRPGLRRCGLQDGAPGLSTARAQSTAASSVHERKRPRRAVQRIRRPRRPSAGSRSAAARSTHRDRRKPRKHSRTLRHRPAPRPQTRSRTRARTRQHRDRQRPPASA